MAAERSRYASEEGCPEVRLERVIQTFDDLIGRFGEHAVAAGDEVYIQPYVDLSLHLIQMRVAGWTDMDYDQLAAVSGASALYGYEPGAFMPKYAHLDVSPGERIAEATGFGYEWVGFEGMDGAWSLLVESVDAGRPVKGWDWENIMFAGYQDAHVAEDRRVYALADGPDTYAKWLTWGEFGEWAKRVEGWKAAQLGRHTERIPTKPVEEVALRVIRDLVAWSTEPPEHVRESYPKVTFGLAGIAAYAADCADIDTHGDWTACHDINPQWTVRNSTGVYLKRVAGSGAFSEGVNAHLLAAAEQYRAAYECWQAFYALLGHKATEGAKAVGERRLAGAAVVRAWQAHEKAGVAAVEKALNLLDR
ncbi:MAG: hypothetical protein ISS56_04780 [Anaerolineae bacterium]|nr:hypothetical protein [Anaerolineae bacterium]